MSIDLTEVFLSCERHYFIQICQSWNKELFPTRRSVKMHLCLNPLWNTCGLSFHRPVLTADPEWSANAGKRIPLCVRTYRHNISLTGRSTWETQHTHCHALIHMDPGSLDLSMYLSVSLSGVWFTWWRAALWVTVRSERWALAVSLTCVVTSSLLAVRGRTAAASLTRSSSCRSGSCRETLVHKQHCLHLLLSCDRNHCIRHSLRRQKRSIKLHKHDIWSISKNKHYFSQVSVWTRDSTTIKKKVWHSIMNKAYVNIWPQLYLMFYCFKGILKQLSFKNTELVWC